MITKLAKPFLVALAVASSVVFGILAVSAHAQQMPPAQMQGGGGMGHGMMGMGGHASGTRRFGPGPARIPGVFGKVTAINGTTLSLTSMGRTGPMGMASTSAMIYSVDASSATVLKNGTLSTFSAIAVGDTIMAQGMLTGNSVTATKIIDGVEPGMMRGGPSSTFPGGWHGYPSSTASSTGNPVQPSHGFFGGIMNFFGGIFGHFKL